MADREKQVPPGSQPNLRCDRRWAEDDRSVNRTDRISLTECVSIGEKEERQACTAMNWPDAARIR